MKKLFKFTPLLAIGYWLLAALPVSAAGLVTCNGPVAGNGLPACNVCSLLQMISNIVKFIVLDITMPLAGLLFLIGGIMMVAAGGSEERFKKGKKVFTSTVFGILIVLGSWVIINTLITTFGPNVSGFVSGGSWWNVKCK